MPEVSSASEVTDEVRNRYGELLDRAAERGLLSPFEYQERLGRVAEATSEDELRVLVTELPAFGAPVPMAERDPALGVLGLPELTPTGLRGPRRRDDRQRRLVIVVVLMVLALAASMVVLLAFAHHVAQHPPVTPAPGGVVSALRL